MRFVSKASSQPDATRLSLNETNVVSVQCPGPESSSRYAVSRTMRGTNPFQVTVTRLSGNASPTDSVRHVAYPWTAPASPASKHVCHSQPPLVLARRPPALSSQLIATAGALGGHELSQDAHWSDAGRESPHLQSATETQFEPHRATSNTTMYFAKEKVFSPCAIQRHDSQPSTGVTEGPALVVPKSSHSSPNLARQTLSESECDILQARRPECRCISSPTQRHGDECRCGYATGRSSLEERRGSPTGTACQNLLVLTSPLTALSTTEFSLEACSGITGEAGHPASVTVASSVDIPISGETRSPGEIFKSTRVARRWEDAEGGSSHSSTVEPGDPDFAVQLSQSARCAESARRRSVEVSESRGVQYVSQRERGASTVSGRLQQKSKRYHAFCDSDESAVGQRGLSVRGHVLAQTMPCAQVSQRCKNSLTASFLCVAQQDSRFFSPRGSPTHWMPCKLSCEGTATPISSLIDEGTSLGEVMTAMPPRSPPCSLATPHSHFQSPYTTCGSCLTRLSESQVLGSTSAALGLEYTPQARPNECVFGKLSCVSPWETEKSSPPRSVSPCSSTSADLWVAKVIDLKSLPAREVERAMREAHLLRRFRHHPNVVQFRESFLTEAGQLVIIMEYCPGGDLLHLIERKQQQGRLFTEEQVMRWFKQVLNGLQFIHSQDVLHCDIKSTNIFLGADGAAKIGDFGIAKEFSSKFSNSPVSLGLESRQEPAEPCECFRWSTSNSQFFRPGRFGSW